MKIKELAELKPFPIDDSNKWYIKVTNPDGENKVWIDLLVNIAAGTQKQKPSLQLTAYTEINFYHKQIRFTIYSNVAVCDESHITKLYRYTSWVIRSLEYNPKKFSVDTNGTWIMKHKKLLSSPSIKRFSI